MSWKDILKEDAQVWEVGNRKQTKEPAQIYNPPDFISIEQLVEWMVNNNIKNSKEIKEIFEKIVEDDSKMVDVAANELRPHTNAITRQNNISNNLREQWTRLLNEEKIMGV